MAAIPQRDVGVRLIVFYKVAKAIGEIVLAIGLVALAATGEIELLQNLAHKLHENLASRWSLMVGRALAAFTSQRGVHFVEIGLALDGLLSLIEGWSLSRRYRWGPWLVVFATAAPLPLEVMAIARRYSGWRVVLGAINVLVVLYLARQIARRRSTG